MQFTNTGSAPEDAAARMEQNDSDSPSWLTLIEASAEDSNGAGNNPAQPPGSPMEAADPTGAAAGKAPCAARDEKPRRDCGHFPYPAPPDNPTSPDTLLF